MEKPSFDSAIALWQELKPKEQLALVNSDNRPAIKKFLASILSTFQSLLDACHQTGYRNSDFIESCWPLEPIAIDEADYEVVEHHLTETGPLELEEGIKQLEKLAVKDEICLLTGSRRAMEYIAQHQDAQLDHPIILPLRARHSNGHWCLPVFDGILSDRQRYLVLRHASSKFDSHYSWLVLRKRQK